MDFFPIPEMIAAGDNGLKIDKSHVGRQPVPLLYRVSPDLLVVDGSGNWSMRRLGQLTIVPHILHIWLVQLGIPGVAQNLVDSAARHNVPGQKHGDHLVGDTVAYVSCHASKDSSAVGAKFAPAVVDYREFGSSLEAVLLDLCLDELL
jgi:hypothetical protein